jgi:hypothetical protein
MSLQTWQETLTFITADGTALTAAARASLTQGPAQAGRITLATNFFYVGRMIKVTAQGRISCAVTTPGTGRLDLSLGGTANVDSGAFALNVVAKTNVPWWTEIVGTCRSVGNGTSATVFWFGSFTSEALVGSGTGLAGSTGHGTVLFTNGGLSGATAVGAGFDSTASQALDLNWTPSLTTASITLQVFKVEALN